MFLLFFLLFSLLVFVFFLLVLFGSVFVCFYLIIGLSFLIRYYDDKILIIQYNISQHKLLQCKCDAKQRYYMTEIYCNTLQWVRRPRGKGVSKANFHPCCPRPQG